MPQRCDVQNCLGNPKPYCCQSMPSRCQVGKFFVKSRQSYPKCATTMAGWGPFGKLEAIPLPDYASGWSGWETFGKIMAMISRLLCQNMHLRWQVGHLWETQSHSIAGVCLRDARFGSFSENHSHNIATVCLQDVRLGGFLESSSP